MYKCGDSIGLYACTIGLYVECPCTMIQKLMDFHHHGGKYVPSASVAISDEH